MDLKGGRTERLRAARAASSFTQAAIAKTLGYKPETVANWERGRSTPSLEDLVHLALSYEVSLDWLLTGHARLVHRFEQLQVKGLRCDHLVPLTERCLDCEGRARG